MCWPDERPTRDGTETAAIMTKAEEPDCIPGPGASFSRFHGFGRIWYVQEVSGPSLKARDAIGRRKYPRIFLVRDYNYNISNLNIFNTNNHIQTK